MRIFDAHLHVIDPRFPRVANQGYLPEPFTIADYRRRTEAFDILGGTVVSGSFQGFDQSYLVAALEDLGSGFVGVTQLPATVEDDEIHRLDQRGVRAVRFNLHRGGSESIGALEPFAHRIHDLAGWHVELYVSSRDLESLSAVLAGLPRVVVDHLGLSREGWPTLLRLVEKGLRVKATGFSRLDFDPIPAVREVVAIDPGAVVFGTDLPSTRAPRPFLDEDARRLADALADEDLVERVFVGNAIELYRPGFLAEKRSRT